MTPQKCFRHGFEKNQIEYQRTSRIVAVIVDDQVAATSELGS